MAVRDPALALTTPAVQIDIPYSVNINSGVKIETFEHHIALSVNWNPAQGMSYDAPQARMYSVLYLAASASFGLCYTGSCGIYGGQHVGTAAISRAVVPRSDRVLPLRRIHDHHHQHPRQHPEGHRGAGVKP